MGLLGLVALVDVEHEQQVVGSLGIAVDIVGMVFGIDYIRVWSCPSRS
jgi:hypothetical protein